MWDSIRCYAGRGYYLMQRRHYLPTPPALTRPHPPRHGRSVSPPLLRFLDLPTHTTRPPATVHTRGLPTPRSGSSVLPSRRRSSSSHNTRPPPDRSSCMRANSVPRLHGTPRYYAHRSTSFDFIHYTPARAVHSVPKRGKTRNID